MNRMTKTLAALIAGCGLVLGGAAIAASDTAGASDTSEATNWFGGPVYTGEPALPVTAALVEAGRWRG